MSESNTAPRTPGWLSVANPASRFVLQGELPALAAAASALGFESDVSTNEARDNGQFALLWLGPDERLILAWQEGARQLAPRIANALAGHAHSLVDVTHR